MKKFIECNDLYFEVKKPIEKPTSMFRKDLYECYKKPSTAKESI